MENAIYDIQSWGKDEGISHPFIRSIFDDSYGYLWIATAGGGFNRFDGKHITHLSRKEGLEGQTYIIKEDSKGNLWFGMYGGLARYDGTNITYYSEKEGMIGVSTLFIFEDSKGNLWFGSIKGGVTKFDGKSFTHYTENEGLKGMTVLSIEEDILGNLWFNTQEGISIFDGFSFAHFPQDIFFDKCLVVKIDNRAICGLVPAGRVYGCMMVNSLLNILRKTGY
jgi:two-component system, sensor histidine kinase ChiS